MFTPDELILIQKALWDRVKDLDGWNDHLIKDLGIPHAEVYQRRHHLHDEVWTLLTKVENAIKSAQS